MSTTRSSRQYLYELTNSCKNIIDATQQMFSPLDTHQLNWKPAPDSWSVAQCLDHLNTTNAAYYGVIEPLLPPTGVTGGAADRPFRSGIMGSIMIWTLQPNRRIKMSAPRAIAPSQSALPHAVIDDFAASQQQLLIYIERSAGLDLTSISLTSPLSSFVRLNLGAAYGIMVTHTQRHLLQASRVMQRQGFPA